MSDCTGQTTVCTNTNWPGYRTTAWHALSGDGPDIRTWFGGLVDGMRDASGQMYMRNRYYDPGTGQFTQTDPIGLAGGLNTYGFAAGDPVSYADPYGLCANGIGPDYHHGRCGGTEGADRSDLRRRLNAGEILKAGLAENVGGMMHPFASGLIWLNNSSHTNSFALQDDDLAFVLSEELHHSRQFDPSRNSIKGVWATDILMMALSNVFLGYERNPYEIRAHAYACSVTTGKHATSGFLLREVV